MSHLTFSALSDVGRAREHNEDNMAACPDHGLWVVADGMGGHEAGEVASAIVIETICDATEKGTDLMSAIEMAHESIIQSGKEGRGVSGMGSTVVALKVTNHSYKIAWVGDSRGYLWDGEHLRQLTRDHSFVQQMMDAGAISAEEANHHPDRNVISQALGVGESSELIIDEVSGRLYRNTHILLCSDGLTSEIDNSHIATILAKDGDAEEKVQNLINAANENGGSDNITVIMVSAPEDAPEKVNNSKTVPFDASALNEAIKQNEQKKWSWRKFFKRED